MGLSKRRKTLFCKLAQSCSIGQAIETGTWQGSTTRTLREIFPTVISVELIEEIWRAAKQRNQDLTDVEFILGESGQMLNKLEVNHGSRPTLFYLDAHCGSFYTPEQIRPRKKDEPWTPAGTTTQCPLEAEIAAIDKWPSAAESCLLIDDARVFLGPHPGFRHEDWPAFIEVVDLIRKKHPRFITVLDDMIIAVPPAARSTVESWWLDEAAKAKSASSGATLRFLKTNALRCIRLR